MGAHRGRRPVDRLERAALSEQACIQYSRNSCPHERWSGCPMVSPILFFSFWFVFLSDCGRRRIRLHVHAQFMGPCKPSSPRVSRSPTASPLLRLRALSGCRFLEALVSSRGEEIRGCISSSLSVGFSMGKNEIEWQRWRMHIGVSSLPLLEVPLRLINESLALYFCEDIVI